MYSWNVTCSLNGLGRINILLGLGLLALVRGDGLRLVALSVCLCLLLASHELAGYVLHRGIALDTPALFTTELLPEYADFLMSVLALEIAGSELLVHGLDVRIDVVGFVVQLLDERALLGRQLERQPCVKLCRRRLNFLLEDVLLLRPPLRQYSNHVKEKLGLYADYRRPWTTSTIATIAMNESRRAQKSLRKFLKVLSFLGNALIVTFWQERSIHRKPILDFT
jgi:hypothetical protein